MLVLSRKVGERVLIGDGVVVQGRVGERPESPPGNRSAAGSQRLARGIGRILATRDDQPATCSKIALRPLWSFHLTIELANEIKIR
jgi:hypothetical protein